jgi:hypothetical protein
VHLSRQGEFPPDSQPLEKSKKIMNSRFTHQEILSAREFWRELSYLELFQFWKHYTTGKGYGNYPVSRDESFADYLVISANHSSLCRALDC